MTLEQVVSQLKNFDPTYTVYAAEPWTASSTALVLPEDVSGGLPREAQEFRLAYFLEISVALEFLEGWLANVGSAPSLAEKTERLIQYAINDC